MLVVFATSAFIAIQSGRIRQKSSLQPPNALTPTLTSEKDLVLRCNEGGGTWLTAYNECEGLDKQTCTELGGKYEPCASACRHKPDTEVCIQICVEVCSFGESDPGEPTL